MKHYPVNLNIKGRNCLVVGGGRVGARKAKALARCGALVTIVSPEFSDRLDNQNNITLKKKPYDVSDLDNMFLVFGATDNQDINRQVWQDAQQKNILCSIADFPEGSSFILPAVVRRGDLVITVSTSGSSPAFAKKLKKDLENAFGEEYAEFLYLMGRIRKRLLDEKHAPEEHKAAFEAFISNGLLDMIKAKEISKIDDLLFKILGSNYTYNDLASRRE